MNTNELTISLNEQEQVVCRQKFETPVGEIENSYLCGQSRFTSADIWSLQKQKREFPTRNLDSVLLGNS